MSSVAADTSVDFFRAVNVDNDRTVRALLARGFDPNQLDESGQLPLFLALRDDAPKVAAALLEHPRLRVDATNAADETPLMMAALRGQIDFVPRLIDKGGRVNRSGWAPLHYAASGPEPRVVALLLDRGAQVDARSPDGKTALMMAASYGPEDTAVLLLARGADARLRAASGVTAAELARFASREGLAERLERAAR